MATYKLLVRDYYGWQAPVLDILNDPPGTPAEGDRYLIDTAPTGAWIGHAKDIATYNGTGWDFATPAEGWFVYDIDSNARYLYNGSAWAADAAGGEVNTGSNQGTDGVGVYDTKVGVDLQFRHVAPGSTKVTTTLNGKDIDIDIVESNIAHNNLSGYAAENHRAANWSANQKVVTIVI